MAGPNKRKPFARPHRRLSATHAGRSGCNHWHMLRVGSNNEAPSVLCCTRKLPELFAIRNMPSGGDADPGEFHGDSSPCLAVPDRCI